MNTTKRIVLLLYCVAIAYGTIWIPWRVPVWRRTEQYERASYGWVWAGPYRAPDVVYDPPIKGDVFDVVGEEARERPPLTASPDFPRIGLRLMAITAIFLAAFAATGFRKSA